MDNFCYFPFTQLLLDVNGIAKPCCWNFSYSLGDISKKSIEEIWNDEPIQRLREEFLAGRPEICASRMLNRNCHKASQRDYTETVQLNIIQDSGPIRLDVRLNGFCNLRCIMCDVWKKPLGPYNENNFWSYARESIFPFLKECFVSGGEPFLQQDIFRLIEEVYSVNPECKWSFVTNGHYAVGGKIFIALQKIQISTLHISIDSFSAATYAKIRKGGTLEKVLETAKELLRFQEAEKKRGHIIPIAFCMCIQKTNYKEIQEFLRSAIFMGAGISFQLLVDPAEESILGLPEQQRRELLEDLKGIIAFHEVENLNHVIMELEQSLPTRHRSAKA